MRYPLIARCRDCRGKILQWYSAMAILQSARHPEEAGWKINRAGVREKAGKEARLTLWYASGDSTRRDLAEAVRAMLQPLGIVVSLQSGSWETVERHMHANPTLFGWEVWTRWNSSITTAGKPLVWNIITRAITATLR